MKRPDPDKPIICIVDDDPSVLKALSRLVESAGMCAEPFTTAEEFLTSAPAYSMLRLFLLTLAIRLGGSSPRAVGRA